MGSVGSGLILLVLAAMWGGAAQAACAPDAVELRGPSGQQRFGVEVADDPAEQAQGLMFREKMATSAGMLFVFSKPKRAQFWMKNTLISLDMIFVDAKGVVTRVHSDAVPGDTTPIDGGEGVAFVLEINGGLSKRMGITVGSEMRHESVAQSGAAWPCDGN